MYKDTKEPQRLLENQQKLERGKEGFPCRCQNEQSDADTLLSEV